jgi:hypothetical protein
MFSMWISNRAGKLIYSAGFFGHFWLQFSSGGVDKSNCLRSKDFPLRIKSAHFTGGDAW